MAGILARGAARRKARRIAGVFPPPYHGLNCPTHAGLMARGTQTMPPLLAAALIALLSAGVARAAEVAPAIVFDMGG